MALKRHDLKTLNRIGRSTRRAENMMYGSAVTVKTWLLEHFGGSLTLCIVMLVQEVEGVAHLTQICCEGDNFAVISLLQPGEDN